jgi:transcriptional regulator with XRE-family HTH domain
MKLPIGQVINELRKKSGVTQEQLANAVGVSVPAVSKWESGAAYPDITLLPSIARYFNTTIDCLLRYDKDISEDDVREIISRCARCFEESTLEKAVEMCEKFLKLYPNSMVLYLGIGSLYMSYLSKAAGEEESKGLINKAIELLEHSSGSSDAEISQSSNYLLGTLYSINGNNDKAEEVLSKIPKSKVNPDDMLVSILMSREEYVKAKNLIQTGIFTKLMSLFHQLALLSSIYIKEKDESYAEELLSIQRQLIKLFGLEQVCLPMNSILLAEFYVKQKKADNALVFLEEYAEIALKTDRNLSKHKMFGNMELKGEYPSDDYLNDTMLKLLKQGNEFEFIRDNERFKAILERLKSQSKEIKQKMRETGTV